MLRIVSVNLLIALVCCAVGACGARRSNPVPSDAGSAADYHLRLPRAPGRFAPARIDVAPEVAGESLLDVERCGSCHPDVLAHWRVSAHALSSFNNPIYVSAVRAFREANSARASRFCAGCHDPALLVDGAMDREISPQDPRSHAGITCVMCHGASDTAPDGNGSLFVHAAVVLPDVGDPASVAAHASSVRSKALTNELCIACHRSFVGEDTGHVGQLTGMDDATAWQASAYSGSGLSRIDNVAQADCISCHMARVPATQQDMAAKRGSIASHEFLGGHTWLAAMRGDTKQLQRVQLFLRGAATVDVVGFVSGDQRSSLLGTDVVITPGTDITFDVVIRNVRVGHRFPGGVLDAQDTWIEVTVDDQRARRIAQAGVAHRLFRSPLDRSSDDSVHTLRTVALGPDGTPRVKRQVHDFRGVAFDHTLAPRQARVVRYQFTVPPKPVASPLTVRVRLLHRTRNQRIARQVCKEATQSRGAQFVAAAAALRGQRLDPCVRPPITEIAQAVVAIGPGAEPRASRPDWVRLYEHGIALLADVSERLERAKRSLAAALARVSNSPTARRRAGAHRDHPASAAERPAHEVCRGPRGRDRQSRCAQER